MDRRHGWKRRPPRIAALINLGDDQLPPVVAQALPAVMDALLETLGFLKDDMERARLEEVTQRVGAAREGWGSGG